MQEYLKHHIAENWLNNVLLARDILQRGREVAEQINILGDDGVPIDYHEKFWKAEVVDFIILQQDAFDKIDQSTPLPRQEYMLNKVLEVYHTRFQFETFEEVGTFFKRIINQFKQMNYSEFQSEQFKKYEEELHAIINERKIA